MKSLDNPTPTTGEAETAGGFSAAFGAIHHEDAEGFLFTVDPPQLAGNVARALNSEAALADLLRALQSGLADVDAANASCPMRSGAKSYENCPRCGATPRQNCGPNIGALDRFEVAARAAMAKALGS